MSGSKFEMAPNNDGGACDPHAARTNPRRCPASASASLRPSKRSFNTNFGRSPSGPQDPRRAHTLLHKSSSAVNWFEDANANIGGNRVDSYENEPPFYIQHRPWKDIARADQAGNNWDASLLLRHDSENDDLRSIIDDLTVENKKLKQRLHRYERFHPPALQHDKLFEVRVNGLSGQTKRELEAILSKFISTISSPAHNAVPHIVKGHSSSKYPSSLPYSNPQFADSAYASVSRSHPTSTSQSHQGVDNDGSSPVTKNRNVRSYLHNIPESLLPKLAPAMPEKARMKEVVKRLEQLFTGKTATPGEHSFSEQQEAVSRSAAHADAVSRGKAHTMKDPEGAREALIMPRRPNYGESGGPGEPTRSFSPGQRPSEHVQDLPPTSSSEEKNSPSQRPTRPLDLDLQRAQIPSENMDYIRHLGVVSPELRQDVPSGSPDGWVYLNLLTSMAQLHTINVTPEFIRKAVKEMSTKFELSPDGRKIRWKGGEKGTRLSSDSNSPAEARSEGSLSDNGFAPGVEGYMSGTVVQKSTAMNDRVASTPLTRNHVSDNSASKTTSNFATPCTQPGNGFDYKPIFVGGPRSEYGDDYGLGSSDSYNSSSGRKVTETGRETESGSLTYNKSPLRRHSDEGPIIYYHNSNFCVDLSGDSPGHMPIASPTTYENSSILGVKSPPSSFSDSIRRDSFMGSNSDVDEAQDTDSILQIYEGKDSLRPCRIYSPEPAEFEASGVGGVHPSNNFVLNVSIKRTRGADPESPRLARPPKRRKMFDYEISSVKHTGLPPSALPPPSYIFLPSSPSSGEDEDYFDSSGVESDDESAGSSLDEEQPVPPAFLRKFSSEDVSDETGGGGEGGGDSGSTMAEVDEDERQPADGDDHILKDELPAGSSAATAGGGSGYASEVGSPSALSVRSGATSRPPNRHMNKSFVVGQTNTDHPRG